MLSSPPLESTLRRVRFERLLSRVETRTMTTTQTTRDATRLIKALIALKSQLAAMETMIEPSLLAAYVKRVNNLWTLSKAERMIQAQQSKMRESSAITKPYRVEQPMFDEPPMITASRTLIDPTSSNQLNPVIKETYPIANAAHFSISKPHQVSDQIRNELFEHSGSSNHSEQVLSNDPDDSFANKYDADLTRLAELAPALKHQVKAIADALHVDEAIVDEASRSMEDNVERVKRENVRLKAWTRASCGETCALSGIVVMLLTIFVAMVALIKVVPAPR